MRTVICGANGAMGRLLCDLLGDEVVGKVSIDGENGVPKTFEELGDVQPQVVIDFSHHSAAADVAAYAKRTGCALVVGTTGDPATPYSWSQALTEQLDDARLVTWKGNGHTAYGRSDACVTDAVDDYLLAGVLPEVGLTCG